MKTSWYTETLLQIASFLRSKDTFIHTSCEMVELNINFC